MTVRKKKRICVDEADLRRVVREEIVNAGVSLLVLGLRVAAFFARRIVPRAW